MERKNVCCAKKDRKKCKIRVR